MISTHEYQPVALTFFLAGISRFLLVEEAFGMSLGHGEAIAIVERYLRQLEGDRLVDVNGQVLGSPHGSSAG
jgi:hypothetical protein